MVFGNGVKNIQAAAYNGTCTVSIGLEVSNFELQISNTCCCFPEASAVENKYSKFDMSKLMSFQGH